MIFILQEDRDFSEEGPGSDLDDFIEYDRNADRHYREVSDEESLDGKHSLKKTKKNNFKVLSFIIK